MITSQRIYRPESVSVAHIETENRNQVELWQWFRWAGQSGERDFYCVDGERSDGLSLVDKLPLHRALRDRTAVLSANKRRGHIILTVRLP
jgi:hypothetical protein